MILKIFFAYWIAAGVVIVASDLEPHKLIHTPELSDALDTSLAIVGEKLIEAAGAGTCGAVKTWHLSPDDAIGLFSTEGQLVCGDIGVADSKLAAAAAGSHKRMTRDFARYQVIAMPIIARDGRRYAVEMKSDYTSTLQAFGFLPGIKTLQISIVVTFFLAVLVVMPVRRMRTAARRIACGDLSARVADGLYSRMLAKIGLRDDIDGLRIDLNAMAQRLQALVSTQKLLLRDISHELRSPLARLAVALESARDLVAGEPIEDEMRLHLNRIERESDRLNASIGHILSLSYMETIRELRHKVDLSLSSVVEDLLPDVQYEAQNRDCRIVTSTPDDLIVNGDSDMLRHAVENIVRNAIRYSPPGGTVEIGIAKIERSAVLRVADTGPGVAEEKLNSILNPFYRASESRRSSTNGFGIGLAIADRAAHLHAGRIAARNREGGGLIVELSLPLASSAV